MYLGYNTNGFAHHRLEDAITVLAELGYEGVAITLDHHALNPFGPDLPRQLETVRGLLTRHRLRSVIETGARFLLDPRRKHYPTLVEPHVYQDRRIEFLKGAVDIARELGSDAVSFWSGVNVEHASRKMAMNRLTFGCRPVCAYAAERGVRLAFEPEPGMVIDTMPRFAMLQKRLARFDNFGLTIDVGHLHCQGETPIGDRLRAWRHLLWNVHIEDMRRGVHDHLMFGEGEIDFGEVFAALREIGYPGGVYVELSRHSHDAVETARRALAFLRSVSGGPGAAAR
jgi:sugar phosphate isomerase/epimerase